MVPSASIFSAPSLARSVTNARARGERDAGERGQMLGGPRDPQAQQVDRLLAHVGHQVLPAAHSGTSGRAKRAKRRSGVARSA
jgi:hypothetical protein